MTKAHLRFSPTSIILACVFTGFTAIGLSCSGTLLSIDVSSVANGSAVGFMAIIIIVFALLNVVLAFLFTSLDAFFEGKKSLFSKLVSSEKVLFKHSNSIFVYAGIIFILWAPFFIVNFPGNVYSDAYTQLLDFNDPSMVTQHPFFSSAIIATLYNAGNTLGNNAGVFLIVFLEALFTGVLYVYLIKTMESLGASKLLCVATAVFFGLVPLFATVASTVWKDAFYLGFFVLFQIKTVQLVLSRKDKVLIQQLLVFVIAGIFLCLFRKEGLYVFIATSIILFLVMHKRGKLLLSGAVLAFVLLYSLFGVLGLTTPGVQKGHVSEEMLSIPMQMTARYVITHPDEVTDEEWAVNNEVFLVSTDIPIAEKYNAWTADPIKGFNTFISTETFVRYADIWLKMGFKHPETYFSGFVNSTYASYAPLNWSDRYGTGPLEIVSSEHPSGYYTQYAGAIDFLPQYVNSGELRSLLSKYNTAWRVVPLFRQFVTPGIYIWCMLTLIALLLRKRKFAELSAFVPALVVFAVCLLGPVNGFVRYALPFMACTPLLIAFTLSAIRERSQTSPDVCGNPTSAENS